MIALKVKMLKAVNSCIFKNYTIKKIFSNSYFSISHPLLCKLCYIGLFIIMQIKICSLLVIVLNNVELHFSACCLLVAYLKSFWQLNKILNLNIIIFKGF